ncbi:hypothetical protein [Paraglaciecola sp. 20A4]|uniref:hypothetical protein n=1 Tax=Paraglaciecola sp. 20A4 TaxID=2687288 RepID=UPI0014080FD3|nr:hypothetical protein [Paraglaciecola sp. 20A4]
MSTHFKRLIGFGAFALVAMLAVGKTSVSNETLFCSCPQAMAFDHGLPMSHPINRCAKVQADVISWSGWVTGNSTSYQMHFIDLLELLSRYADESDDLQPRA